MVEEHIRKEDVLECCLLISDKHGEIVGASAEYDRIIELEPVDVVPWSFLERYAEWFYAMGSFPEFIFEAKRFYIDAIGATDGGVIDG